MNAIMLTVKAAITPYLPRYLNQNWENWEKPSLYGKQVTPKCTCCLSINNFYCSFGEFEVAQATNPPQNKD